MDELLNMPAWACGLADGDYTKIGAQLPTRDGRKVGNATVVEDRGLEYHPVTFYNVVTDAGNEAMFTEEELCSLFYPPVYLQNLSGENKVLAAIEIDGEEEEVWAVSKFKTIGEARSWFRQELSGMPHYLLEKAYLNPKFKE